MLDRRLAYAAHFLSSKKEILAVSRKDVGNQAFEAFAKAIGARAITGRFMPGSLTNPRYDEFFEPDALIIADPLTDSQAITEARQMKIPVIGIADTFNETKTIDFVLPANNKGKKSIALIMWILAKTIKEIRGEEFDTPLEEFGYE